VKQPPIHYRHCEECDATSDAAAPHCWLCGRSLSAKNDVIVAERGDGRSETRLEPLFAALTLAAGILSLLLIFGTAPSEPMISAYVAICVGPAFLATTVRALGRRALGRPFTWQSTLVTFVLSVTVILAFFGLLLIAAVILLYVVCLRSFYTQGP
jgi:dolichol kinase